MYNHTHNDNNNNSKSNNNNNSHCLVHVISFPVWSPAAYFLRTATGALRRLRHLRAQNQSFKIGLLLDIETSSSVESRMKTSGCGALR